MASSGRNLAAPGHLHDFWQYSCQAGCFVRWARLGCFVIASLILQVLDSGGEEVRLQRNALTVVSRPKGDETVCIIHHAIPMCILGVVLAEC